MIEIFDQEKYDGLADLMLDNSIAYEIDLKEEDIDFPSSFSKLKELISVAGLDDLSDSTLFRLHSILVTLGWNLNDDVFLKEEVFAARNTPIDKPFNRMHNQQDIIGHMTDAILLDSDYNKTEGPDFEHICVSSVIYKAWRDETRKNEVAQLIQEIQNDKWKVSMECVFAKFDYALITPEGKQVIIPRNPETSHLTKHLRKYKGSGSYNGNRIGRVLRDINFCGKGLVSNPGNPYSVIINKNSNTINKFFGAEASLNEIKELVMNELEQARADLATVQAELATFKANAAKEAEDKLKQALAEKETVIAGQKEVISGLQENISTINSSIASVNTELETLKSEKTVLSTKLETSVAELNAIKAEQALAERKESLAKLEIVGDRAEAILAQYASSSKELFDTFVNTIAAFVPFKKKGDDEKTEDKKDDKKKDSEAKCETENKADFSEAKVDEEAALSATASAKVNEDGTKISEYLKANAFTAGKSSIGKVTKNNKGDK